MSVPVERIPDASLRRLFEYLQSLEGAAANGVSTVSSELLAEMAGYNATTVRKDLSNIGSYGTRGIGYDVVSLRNRMRRQLGGEREQRLAIVGIGHLGIALANSDNFESHGYEVVALFDKDPAKIGQQVGSLAVDHIDDMANVVAERKITMGIITVPPAVAQKTAFRLVEAGVLAILNFSSTTVLTPPHVYVRRVDLSIEAQMLSFLSQQAEAQAAAAGAVDIPTP